MTNSRYRGLVDCAADFVLTLGHLPRDCPVDYISNRNAALAERIREDARKVAVFHPQIDPALLIANLTLEEVIRYGIKEHEIEIFHGVFGVTAERCYQIGGRLPDSRILGIKKKVYAEYKRYFDDKALELTERTLANTRRRAEEAADLARAIVS
jgi:hypothetical protein